MNERMLISRVIKYGSYTGVAIAGTAVLIRLAGGGHTGRADAVFDVMVRSAVILLILTPVCAMLSSGVYFLYKKDWKWAAAALGLGVLILLSVVLSRL